MVKPQFHSGETKVSPLWNSSILLYFAKEFIFPVFTSHIALHIHQREVAL